MQVRNNEITVFRGETWTMSKIIQNKDGSPYIINSRLKNPYWLITVSSSRYEQPNRYVLNKWLELKDFPRFEITQPVNLKSINSDYTFENTNVPAGYEGNETSGYANIAIFYEKDSNGVISYKYWEYINNIEGNYEGQWVDYRCPIITTFSSDITSKWIEQNYYYGILLVDGTSVSEYLIETANGIGIDFSDIENDVDFIEKLYDRIIETDASIVEGLDVDKPLIGTEETYIILEPTKLYVMSNLKGGTI